MRQHIVSKMLQGRFTDEHGRIFVFNKKARENGVFQTTPLNAFVRKHIYSMVLSDGTKEPSLEHLYARIETVANDVIGKIVDAARADKVPGLSAYEKAVWDAFVYHQWKRSPEFFERYASPESFAELLPEIIKEVEAKYGALNDEQRRLLADPDERARIAHNARVGALGNPGVPVMEVMASRGLGIARIAQPNKSFIIGSFPVVKLNHPGTPEITHPTTEVWLPISSDVAVTVAGPAGSERLAVVPGGHHIRAINLAVAKQSTVIAGRSGPLIHSLANPR